MFMLSTEELHEEDDYSNSQTWTVASLATGGLGLVSLLLAVSTTHWLHMHEKCLEKQIGKGSNITIIFNFTFYSNAGLWCICTRADDADIGCTGTGLDYGLEKGKEDRVDSQWRTGTVTEATRIQFPLTCSAVFLTVAGFVCSIVGNFRRDKRIIIAAILYICSGLCLSVSVILFVSRINDELSLQQSRHCTDLRYHYGWSFYLLGIAFVLEESSAVLAIKLYLMCIRKSIDDLVRIIPGLEDKFCVQTKVLVGEHTYHQTLI